MITLLKALGPRTFDQQIQFIRNLEGKNILDRSLESMPDDATLEDYAASQSYLSRSKLLFSRGMENFIIMTRLFKPPFLMILILRNL